MRPDPRRADRLRLLAGLALAGTLILPLVPLALWSVAQGWRFPHLLPQAWSGRAWAHALDPASGVLESLALTTLIALATTFIAALVGVPAGRALGLYRFRGKGIVTLLLLAPAVLPAIAVVFGLHGVFLRLGLTGTVAGVILAHLVPVLPYMTLVMAAVFARLDPELEAQARTLGATPFQTFRCVTLPAILPGLMTAGLFAFLVSWSQYLLTLAIGGGKVQTLPLLMFSFSSAGRNDITGAIALIYILPGLLVLILTARQVTGRGAALTQGLRP
ncbi:ABC transporter permease [Rhodobacter calidifons]|uniref:ABC transporter permease subunit n=1 Tax=Rhodobacter calidifons TaxID=2715277 RepID=A0ABX0GCG2_9RHOB|nr:ABC transporter permease subunit [Rhodobacter calidifons]NHB78495.1 ABC transporter permease subunit [Rhodobacter calidifons]